MQIALKTRILLNNVAVMPKVAEYLSRRVFFGLTKLSSPRQLPPHFSAVTQH
jgi:hypothetical protein